MADFETIEVKIKESENFAILSLNRCDQLNAMNTQLTFDFVSAMELISKNERIRCLVITGKGSAFCAGGDLLEFNQADDPGKHLQELAIRFHKGIKLLRNMNAPSVALVNGACYGVGLSLACACDFRICTPDAKFALAFTNVGASPDSGLTFHLPRIVGLPMANEMALLNRVLNAEEAFQYNLVNKILSAKPAPSDEVDDYIKKLSQGPTLAFGATKKLFLESFSNDLSSQLDAEVKNISENAAREDFREGTSAFLERRKPNFKGK